MIKNIVKQILFLRFGLSFNSHCKAYALFCEVLIDYLCQHAEVSIYIPESIVSHFDLFKASHKFSKKERVMDTGQDDA